MECARGLIFPLGAAFPDHDLCIRPHGRLASPPGLPRDTEYLGLAQTQRHMISRLLDEEGREASGKAARSLNDLWHSYADLPLPCSDDYCSLHGVQQQPCVSWCADGPISMLLNPALPSSPSPLSPSSSPPPALLLFFTRRHCASTPARHLHHSSLIVY